MNRFTGVFLPLLFGWISYYLCQRSLPTAMAVRMLHEGHASTESTSTSDSISKGDLGMLQSCFAVAYAISVFANGFLTDRYNPTSLFSFGLVSSGILCLLFPLTDGSIYLSCLVWFMSGLFQGCGWPSSAKLLRMWYSPEEIGIWWSMVSCSGNLVASVLQYFLKEVTDWRYFFYLIGTTALIVSILISFTLRHDSPTSNMNHREREVPPCGATMNGSSHKTSSKPLPWYGAMLMIDVWIVALLHILWWIAQASVMDWGQLYLEEIVNLPTKSAATTVSVVELGNTIGKLSVGPLSVWLTRRNKKRNGLSSSSTSVKFTMIFAIAVKMMVLMYLFGIYPSKNANEVSLMVMFFIIGAVVEGGFTLNSLCSIEVVPRYLSGSALGFTVAAGQIVGRSAAGWPFSQVVERVGWNKAYQLIGTMYVASVALSGHLMVKFNSLSRNKLKTQ